MRLKHRIFFNVVNATCLMIMCLVAIIPVKHGILGIMQLTIVALLGMMSLLCTAYTE